MDKEKLYELTVIFMNFKNLSEWFEDRLTAANKCELGFSTEENPYIGLRAAFSAIKSDLGNMEKLLKEINALDPDYVEETSNA